MSTSARIVHLGLGAFFRAHGAVYLQDAIGKSGGDWDVIGVSMTSSRVKDLLSAIDFQYTAVEVSENGLSPRKVDVVKDVLVAPDEPKAVLDAMTSPSTFIVSLTVTEKGYLRSSVGAGVDLNHPDVQHDLNDALPRSAPGLIVRALDIRRQSGLRPFTVMSLDNLPSNGEVLRKVVRDLADRIDPALAEWIDQDVRFPSTMVDRIVPATTPEMVNRLYVEKGIKDPAAVFHEPFRQWVIEDRFVDDVRPEFETAGAILTRDVEPYERMKLRMLNGTHSALAYVGSLAGRETVAEAVRVAEISTFIQRLWHDEIAPTVKPPPGVDLSSYAAQLLTRYRNPEIKHKLSQIAADGSQKLPQRILDPLFENIRAGRAHAGLMTVLASWIRFLQTRKDANEINDPLRAELFSAVSGISNEEMVVRRVLAIHPVFGSYPTHEIETGLVTMLGKLYKASVLELLTDMQK